MAANATESTAIISLPIYKKTSTLGLYIFSQHAICLTTELQIRIYHSFDGGGHRLQAVLPIVLSLYIEQSMLFTRA